MNPPTRFLFGVVPVILLLFSLTRSELKPFEIGSMRQILDARQGEAFLLILWSVDCPPCLRELDLLKQMRREFSPADLVLISTDDPQKQSSVEEILDASGLDGFDNWILSGNYRESLRYQIDPGWFGQLPRAYFYAPDHRRTGHSGILSKKVLETWLKEQTQASGRI